MIKAILFDADGVALKTHRYFTEVCAEKYNLTFEKIAPFFKGPFQECQIGKADLKIAIEPYLKEFGWPKTVDEYLQEWFVTDSQKNDEVIAFVAEMKSTGILCCLATDQEKYRAQYLLNNLDFKTKFDKCFFSCELGVSKSDKTFFEKVLQDLNCEPNELIYFDDDQSNVDAAGSLGIDARLYNSFEQLKQL